MNSDTGLNSFQRFFNFLIKKSSYKKELIPNISIDRPEVQFRVLKALKKQGLYFVDTETGEYIDGLIDYPSIGLTFEPPTQAKIKKTNIGFLCLGEKNEIEPETAESNYFELDAILYFEYEGPECITGPIEGEPANLYFLKIWNDIEIRQWEEIIENVIKALTVEVNGYSLNVAKFVISSTFVPNDPTAKNKLIIARKTACSDTDAVSDLDFEPDEDFDEDFDEFTPRYKF